MKRKAEKGSLWKLASFLARYVDKLKNRYPKKQVKNKVAFITFLITGLPLLILILLFQTSFMILDIFIDLSSLIRITVQIVFILLYLSILIFVIFEVKSWWDMVDIIYEPLKTIEERTSERVMVPIRDFMIKLDLVIGSVMFVIFTAITIIAVFHEFSIFLLFPVIITFVLGGSLIGISVVIYFLLKGILIFLFDVLWRKLDDKFHFTDTLNKKWDDMRYVDIDDRKS